MYSAAVAYLALIQCNTAACIDYSEPAVPVRWSWHVDNEGIRILCARIPSGAEQLFHDLIHPEDLKVLRDRAAGVNVDGTQDSTANVTRH